MSLALLIGAMFGMSRPDCVAAARVPWTTSRVLGSPNPPAPYTAERQFPALNFQHPVDLALLPGSDRWFLLEQGGKLLSFPGRTNSSRADLVFDFSKHHQPFDSSYAIAFHPQFAENHFLFVCYVEPGGRTNGSFISRFTVSRSDPPTVDPASEQVIIRWLSGGHNGCTIAFGNDGFLYISTGDGASPDPPDVPYNTGQDISDLLAGILRIDIDHREGTNSYAIPADNPFRKTPGARPEVYAFGLRNPWRMSFDRPTGDLWVGDVGWEQWEMVYRIKPGGNYGWSITEGPNTHVRPDTKPGPGPIQQPLIALPHSEAASITGGVVYRGKRLAGLRGAYVYGDWETGKFWALRHDGDKLTSNDELCDTSLKPVTFALDLDGELLFVDYNGGIYSLVPNTAAPANLSFPRKLSETGIYADLKALSPAAGVVPYRINAEMWNDLATAERLLGVPGEGAVVSAGGRETIAGRMWRFPSNTVFARTLTIDMEPGQRSPAHRIETQVLHFEGQTWNAYSYRWNAAQTDAELVPAGGANDVFTVTNAAFPGGRREIPWRFHGRAECLRCHNVWAGETLSFSWLQLNATGELERLEKLGVLKVKDAPSGSSRLANPYDTSRGLADRARSWLHVNCSNCHRNGAGGDVPSWFNYDLTLAESRAYDAKPVRGDFGIVGARVIAPGDPFRSTLFYRISTEASGRMPHIGSRVVDEAGARLMCDWIRSLPNSTNDTPELLAARKLAQENNSLLASFDSLDRAGRAVGMAKLSRTVSGALSLLDHVTSTADKQNLRVEAAALAASHTNAVIRDLFQRLLPPEQRRRTLGADFSPQTILGLQGSAARGELVFTGTSQCARCHICKGAGRAFGPDLTGISRKYSRAQVLEQILYPSRIIAPEHRTTIVTLRDDSEISGFVLKRTSTELILRDEQLIEHKFTLADLKDTRESALSAMPEGLLSSLTAQEAADLLDYLWSTDAGAVSKP